MFQTEDKNCCLCRVAIIGEAIGRFIRAFEMEFNVWKTSALKLTLTNWTWIRQLFNLHPNTNTLDIIARTQTHTEERIAEIHRARKTLRYKVSVRWRHGGDTKTIRQFSFTWYIERKNCIFQNVILVFFSNCQCWVIPLSIAEKPQVSNLLGLFRMKAYLNVFVETIREYFQNNSYKSLGVVLEW